MVLLDNSISKIDMVLLDDSISILDIVFKIVTKFNIIQTIITTVI